MEKLLTFWLVSSHSSHVYLESTWIHSMCPSGNISEDVHEMPYCFSYQWRDLMLLVQADISCQGVQQGGWKSYPSSAPGWTHGQKIWMTVTVTMRHPALSTWVPRVVNGAPCIKLLWHSLYLSSCSWLVMIQIEEYFPNQEHTSL